VVDTDGWVVVSTSTGGATAAVVSASLLRSSFRFCSSRLRAAFVAFFDFFTGTTGDTTAAVVSAAIVCVAVSAGASAAGVVALARAAAVAPLVFVVSLVLGATDGGNSSRRSEPRAKTKRPRPASTIRAMTNQGQLRKIVAPRLTGAAAD